MDMPEPLRELVDQLGEALVRALATDPASRELVGRIQGEGYDVGLMLEATVALHKREEEPGPEAAASEPDGPAVWSPEDRAFLKSFKIALD